MCRVDLPVETVTCSSVCMVQPSGLAHWLILWLPPFFAFFVDLIFVSVAQSFSLGASVCRDPRLRRKASSSSISSAVSIDAVQNFAAIDEIKSLLG